MFLTDMTLYDAYLYGYERGQADAELHWIPCSERLPDHNAEVLVTNADETEIGRRRRYDGKWVDCYGDKMKDVTAWMPLPEPYTERRLNDI